MYLRDDNDIQRMVTNLFKNTTPKGAQTQDPFWDQAATMLLMALVFYLHYEAPVEEQNFTMVIFFDWNSVEFADHCGIVEKVENGYVYTIEGNSKDAVRRGTWQIGDKQIMGYGWIA